MTVPLVYLAGTITQDPKHFRWREQVADALALDEIGTLNPTRGQKPSDWRSDGLDSTQSTPYDDGGFVTRDLRDIDRCDAVLLSFAEAPDRQSIGTWFEFGYAVKAGKPVIVVSTLPEVVQHPFIYKQADRIVATFGMAQEYLQFLFQPGAGE